MQMLKLKRIRRKCEIPNVNLMQKITVLWLNEQVIIMYRVKCGNVYFHNEKNDKWYELINHIDDIYEM